LNRRPPRCKYEFADSRYTNKNKGKMEISLVFKAQTIVSLYIISDHKSTPKQKKFAQTETQTENFSDRIHPLPPVVKCGKVLLDDLPPKCTHFALYYAMSDYWTLHVKDFAKIREAKIEAAPLTFFVGDNNSGKSYLLSLLWGLTGGINFRNLALNGNGIRFDEVQKLLDYWKTRDYGGDSTLPAHLLPIDAGEQHTLAKGFNTFLTAKKDKVVSEIFNADDIPVGSIHLDIPFLDNLGIHFQKQNPPGLDWSLDWSSDSCQRLNSFQDESTLDFVGRYFDLILDRSVFIPAPRSGFLLTFKTLAQSSIRSTFSREPKSGDSLTGPQVSYLERLTSLKRKAKTVEFRPSIQGILDYVERDIIHGELIITDTPLPEILYKPDGLAQALPLYLSSGVATEVAGFLSLLKFGQFGRICIYEEPEMCLHPELQWKMARVLVKMVNAGITVWVSTHSDVIIQHVNNMIKLSNRLDSEQLREGLKYDQDDVISSDKVRMYQFDVAPSDHKTNVRPLECGKNGFRIPTFGKVFREMKDEVWSLRIEKEDAV